MTDRPEPRPADWAGFTLHFHHGPGGRGPAGMTCWESAAVALIIGAWLLAIGLLVEAVIF